MLDLLQEKYCDVTPEGCFSIDEHIIRTKACCPIRQYLLNKPNKFVERSLGTLWDKCFLYDFSVYLGKHVNTDISLQVGNIWCSSP